MEVTAGARHPVWALFEEGVGAIPVPEVVVLPRLVVGSGAGGDGAAILPTGISLPLSEPAETHRSV